MPGILHGKAIFCLEITTPSITLLLDRSNTNHRIDLGIILRTRSRDNRHVLHIL
ncbi:Uncharacterised protein [Segatella copri]|nr:Uncharacterised protein [Segatella copri]